MSSSYRHVLASVANTLWAMERRAAHRLLAVLARRAAGTRYSVSELQAAVAADVETYDERRAAARAASRTAPRIAVVPVYGTILGRDWEFGQVSHGGTTSAEALARKLRTLDADAGIGAIVLDIDSPGGAVSNLPETGEVVASIGKPVIAQVNSMACSAAYWLASQADEIVAAPSSEVGSIGVVMLHQDLREHLAQEGIGIEVLRAGEHKYAGNPFEELTDAARADLQARLDDIHAMFLAAVARGRGTTPKRVRSDFGDGRVFGAKEAARIGMVDRIGTLEDTLARLSSGARVRKRAAASAEPDDGPVTTELVVPVSPQEAKRPDPLDEIEIRERELAL